MTPAEWIQLAAVLGMLIGLIFSSIALRATERQAAVSSRALLATEQETALRMRPWVGLTECHWEGAREADLGAVEYLVLSYRNVGLLPAHDLACVDISVESIVPEGEAPAKMDGTLVLEAIGSPATVFPNEPAEQWLRINRAALTRFIQWRAALREVTVTGAFSYRSGIEQHRTDFQLDVSFGATLRPDDAPKVAIAWANKTAT